MKVNSYAVISKCVDDGLEYGWNRAHKYTATPTAEGIKDEMMLAVMNQIGEYFIFEDA